MSSPARRTSGRKFRPVKRLPRKRVTDDSEAKEKKLSSRINLSPNAKLYYTKIGMGASLGITSGVLSLDPLIGWTLAILGIILAVFIVRYVYEISEEQLDQKRVILAGTFSFILVMIVTWSLSWMIMIPDLPSPR